MDAAIAYFGRSLKQNRAHDAYRWADTKAADGLSHIQSFSSDHSRWRKIESIACTMHFDAQISRRTRRAASNVLEKKNGDLLVLFDSFFM